MRGVVRVALVILFAIVAISAFGLVYYKNIYERNLARDEETDVVVGRDGENSRRDSGTTSPDSRKTAEVEVESKAFSGPYVTNTPGLMSGLDWKEGEVDFPWKIYLGGYLGEEYYPPGQVWVSTSNSDELSDDRDFMNYYMRKLEMSGWSQSVDINGTEFAGTVSDGPLSSINSYVGFDGKNILLFGTKYSTKPTESNGPPFECPCSTDYEVFISDPVPLRDIMEWFEK